MRRRAIRAASNDEEKDTLIEEEDIPTEEEDTQMHDEEKLTEDEDQDADNNLVAKR